GDRDLIRPAESEVPDNTLAGADRDLVRLGQPNARGTAGVRVDDQPRLSRRATTLRVSHPDTGVTAHQLAGLSRRVRRHDDLVRRTGQGDVGLVVITEDLQRSTLTAVTAARTRGVLVVVDPDPSNLQCRWRLVLAVEVVELDVQVPGRHILDIPTAARAAATGVFEPEFPIEVPADETVLAPLVLEREIVPLRHVHARAFEPFLLSDLVARIVIRVVHEGHRLHVARTRVLHEVVFAILRPAIRLRPDQDHRMVIVAVARRGRLTCGRRPDVRTSTNLPTTTVLGVVEVPHPPGVPVRQAGHNELAVLDDLTFRPSTTVPAVAFPVLARETPFGRVRNAVVLELVAPLSQRRAPVVDHRRLHAVHVVVTSPRAANDAGRATERTTGGLVREPARQAHVGVIRLQVPDTITAVVHRERVRRGARVSGAETKL